MRAPLYFRYDGIGHDDLTEIPIEALGKSLIGFDKAIKDFTRIVQLNGQIEIKTISHSEGSIILNTILELNLEVGQLPFEGMKELLDFLKLVGDNAWKEANSFFSEIQGGLKSFNDYFTTRPFDLVVYAYLIPKLINWIRQCANNTSVTDDPLSSRITKELQNMVNKGIFDDALRPIIDESVSSIEVSAEHNFGPHTAKIDSDSISNYLSQDALILPELLNGREYTLEGKITSLKATRGESLTFHYVDKEKAYNLDVIPHVGKSTKDYVQYYKEVVDLTAIVNRTSYYMKPRLHIKDIAFKQPNLDL